MAAHPPWPAATAPPTAPFSPRFRPLPFLGCHLAAALLLLSWLWAPTRQLWDLFDDRIFTLLNHSLRAGGLWAESWALASLRPIDLVTALVMLLVLRRDFAVDRATARRALFGFAAMLGLLPAIRVTFSAVAGAAGWTRASPSLVVDGAIRLSELFPDWEVKDSSTTSFPGDHAAVALLWALFLSLFARGARLALVWLLTLLFLLPRLVAGAHWSSDDFVGGLFVCLLALAWGFYTPFAMLASGWLERCTAPLRNRVKQWPPWRRRGTGRGR